MNLIDDNYYNTKRSNNKILIACGIGIVVLLFIIVGLLAFVTTLNNKQLKLIVDGKNYEAENYIITKDDVLYISIQDLVKITNNGYSYKSGSKEVEDDNKCYITNTYESTFFEVNSNEIYKVLEESSETEYYTLENNIIKENNKIYMPLSAVRTAINASSRRNGNQIIISSIAYIESYYNREKSTNFVPNNSIIWNLTYSNKKLLKYNLVVIKDSNSLYGLGKISATTDDKTKITTVQVSPIIDPKYSNMKFVEKFNQLIVKTESGMGIIQLHEENGNITRETLIEPQYQYIKQIATDLYLVGEQASVDSETTTVAKYGIINEEGDTILPIEYEKIGFDITKFTNNDLNNKYIIYDRYIPVKKDGKWGFVNLTGKVVIKLDYNSIGCIGTNASNNVLIIPNIDGIVVEKDGKYGVVSNSGKVLINNVLTRVYKETVDGEDVYMIVYNNTKYNVLKFLEEQKNKISTNTTTN